MFSGGYDVTFLEEPSDIFKCIICHLVLRQPVMFVECGHRICTSCFEDMKQHAAGQAFKTEIMCPHDRLAVDVTKAVEDKGIWRAILDLRVKCRNVGEGCFWSGELRDMEKHMEESCQCEEKNNTNKLVKQLMQRMQGFEVQLLAKDEQIERLNDVAASSKSEIKRLQQQVGRLTKKLTHHTNNANNDNIKDNSINNNNNNRSSINNNIVKIKTDSKNSGSDAVVGNTNNGGLERNEYISEVDKLSREVDASKSELKRLQQQVGKLTQRASQRSEINNTQVQNTSDGAESTRQVLELRKKVDELSRQVTDTNIDTKINMNLLQTHVMNVEEYVPGEYTRFIWKLENYYEHEMDGEAFSPKFYATPNGHRCMLRLKWYGERRGRLGLYLHRYKGPNDKFQYNDNDFDMDVKFESRDFNGRLKEFEVSWEEDELCQYWGTIAYGKDKCCGHGSDNFLNMPSLKKHLFDDTLTITCTLSVSSDVDDDTHDQMDFINQFYHNTTIF